jgi:hypothetical protein
MCNLYSITTNQAAIIALFRVVNPYVGKGPAQNERVVFEVRTEIAADGSALLPIAWPQSISNQKNKTALGIDTIATILVTIVKVLIRMLVCASRFRTLPHLSEVRDLAAKF